MTSSRCSEAGVQVTCPVVLYWGEGDWLSQPRGAAAVAAQLPNLVDSVRVHITSQPHGDNAKSGLLYIFLLPVPESMSALTAFPCRFLMTTGTTLTFCGEEMLTGFSMLPS